MKFSVPVTGLTTRGRAGIVFSAQLEAWVTCVMPGLGGPTGPTKA